MYGFRFSAATVLLACALLTAPAFSQTLFLPLNGSASGTLGPEHRLDRWSVTTGADGALSVNVVTPAALEVDVYFYDTNGTSELSRDTRYGTASVVGYDRLKPGTYFVAVSYWSGSSSTYTISSNLVLNPLPADSEPNDTPALAQRMEQNATATGHIGYYSGGTSDGYDYFKVTTTADGDLRFTVTQDKDGDLVDLRMYDSNGTSELSRDGGTSKVSTVSVPNLRPGTYYLLVYAIGGSFCGYTVETRLTPNPLANDTEPNDTPATAQTIALNATVTGHIGYYSGGTSDRYDYFKVTTTADGDLRFTVTQDKDGDLVDLRMYDSNGTSELSRDGGTSKVSTVSVPNFRPGTYYLLVYAIGGSFCGYTVETKLTPNPLANDTEPNDTAATAQLALPEKPVTGHLGYFGGGVTDPVDWFKFVLVADGAFWLDIVTDASLEADMELYAGDGATEVARDHRDGIVSRLGKPELAAGVYYLRMYNYSGYGSYTISPSYSPQYVNVLGPTQVIPGESVTYQVRYANPLDVALEHVVVTVDLPLGLNHAGTTGGGIFYIGESCTNRVFWKFGTLAPRTSGRLTFTLSVPWGTPNADTWVYARFGASNLPGGSPFAVEPYFSFVEEESLAESVLSASEAAAAMDQDPALKALYQQALVSGYQYFGTAMGWTAAGGAKMNRLFFLRASDGAPAILTSNGGLAFMEVFAGNTYTIFDTSGGYTWDRDQGQFSPWGAWTEAGRSAMAHRPLAVTGFREARCQFNCTLNSIPDTAASKLISVYGTFKYISECVECAVSMKAGKPDFKNCTKCTVKVAEKNSKTIAEKVPGIGTAVSWAFKVAKCLSDCVANPDLHICTQDRWDCGCSDPIGFLAGYESKCQTPCNKTFGIYAPVSYRVPCAIGQICSDGGCVEKTTVCTGTACKAKTLKVRPSHDPNAKSVDFRGDVIPSQRLTYTLEYENAGSGTAHGVFILDVLDPNLDDATLVINNSGTYSGGSRMLDFEIGDVAPAGKGSVTFSVQVKGNAPAGAEIVNGAEVYFPSALEVTPTNSVVNRVRAAAADPQSLEAVAGVSLPITLTGNSSGGGALSFKIVSAPSFGQLAGTPPNVTYISESQFSGLDAFTFSVADSTFTSAPAEVKIKVNANSGDRTPPQVIATYPMGGVTGVVAYPNPVSTNPPQYLPAISAAFSEPLDSASVTQSSLAVNGLIGAVVYDEAARTVSFIPSVALSPSRTYIAHVSSGVRDKAGNALVSDYSWSFSTRGECGVPPATPVITALTSVVAGTVGLTASVVSHAGSSYAWTIQNGTITAGQGTSQIKFKAGVAGTLSLYVIETDGSSCVSPQGWAAVTVADLVGTALYLSESRVRVSVAWRSQYTGQTGMATALPQDDRFGFFYFFNENNPEVFVKVLDFGEASPYLLFYAGLTDFEYTVEFQNLQTGKSISFMKPAGSFAGGANTDGLPHAVAKAVFWSRDGRSWGAVLVDRSLEEAGRSAVMIPVSQGLPGLDFMNATGFRRMASMMASQTSNDLVLSLSRVAVSVNWRNQYSGEMGQAIPLPQKDEFGFFYFSDRGNPEVFVKVLDFGAGSPYLIFFAGLTNFEYTVTFRNIQTGQSVSFLKEAGSFNGGADNKSLLH